MRWRKRDRWKAGIAIAGMLLLVVMVWLPVSVVDAHERAAGLATPVTGTMQAAPTEDATVTALNKEKIQQDIAKDKSDIAKDKSDLFWAWTASGTIVVGLAGIVFSLVQFFRSQLDERIEREKRDDERFQAVLASLEDEKVGTRVGGAVMLSLFLRPGYERFYRRVFDVTVTKLRSQRANLAHPEQLDSSFPPLITTFLEAFSLARDELKKRKEKPFNPRSLDASHIRLDRAFLWQADLEQVFMPFASLREADLTEAKLGGAQLWWASLDGAKLGKADLKGADLGGANIEKAAVLEGTDLRGLKGPGLGHGLKELLEACKAKGAIIDEDTATSPPQSIVTPPPSQSNDAQDPSSPPAQVSTPPSGTGSSAISSQQSNDAQTQSATPTQVSAPPPDTGENSAASSQHHPES